MKQFFSISILLFLSLSVFSATAASDGFSLKDLKKALKSDSSEQNNTRLASEVSKNGVTFRYTQKRERSLRGWGANDALIDAIWQSIVDEGDEDRLYREFMRTHDSKDKDVRNRALDNGKVYLSRFAANERFAENTERVRKEIRFLECEFDPSLGC